MSKFVEKTGLSNLVKETDSEKENFIIQNLRRVF